VRVSARRYAVREEGRERAGPAEDGRADRRREVGGVSAESVQGGGVRRGCGASKDDAGGGWGKKGRQIPRRGIVQQTKRVRTSGPSAGRPDRRRAGGPLWWATHGRESHSHNANGHASRLQRQGGTLDDCERSARAFEHPRRLAWI